MKMNMPKTTPEVKDLRQWILNIGQEGFGAHHWLWSASGVEYQNNRGELQFGCWLGQQIRAVGDTESTVDTMLQASSLTTVYNVDTKQYTLYVDGEYYASASETIDFHFPSSSNLQLLIGTLPSVYLGNPTQSRFLGCVHKVDIWNSALTKDEVEAL